MSSVTVEFGSDDVGDRLIAMSVSGARIVSLHSEDSYLLCYASGTVGTIAEELRIEVECHYADDRGKWEEVEVGVVLLAELAIGCPAA